VYLDMRNATLNSWWYKFCTINIRYFCKNNMLYGKNWGVIHTTRTH